MKDLSSCPYYRGEGICTSGCQTEPSCVTDEPLGGWPAVRAERLARIRANIHVDVDFLLDEIDRLRQELELLSTLYDQAVEDPE